MFGSVNEPLNNKKKKIGMNSKDVSGENYFPFYFTQIILCRKDVI